MLRFFRANFSALSVLFCSLFVCRVRLFSDAAKIAKILCVFRSKMLVRIWYARQSLIAKFTILIEMIFLREHQASVYQKKNETINENKVTKSCAPRAHSAQNRQRQMDAKLANENETEFHGVCSECFSFSPVVRFVTAQAKRIEAKPFAEYIGLCACEFNEFQNVNCSLRRSPITNFHGTDFPFNYSDSI